MKLDTTGVVETARWALPLAIVAAVVATGAWIGVGTALLVGAGGILVLVIFLLWSSVQALTGETALSLEDALTLAAPSAEEEQKRAVLRALKDLEYERSVGKISDADYRELSTRYRAEAKRLLRVLDADLEDSRRRVEKMLEKRLAREDLPAPDDEPEDEAPEGPDEHDVREPDAEPDDDAESDGEHDDDGESDDASDHGDDESESNDEQDGHDGDGRRKGAAPTRACGECDTRNDLDADFCKKCGTALAPEHRALCRSCPASFDEDAERCPVCGVAKEGA